MATFDDNSRELALALPATTERSSSTGRRGSA